MYYKYIFCLFFIRKKQDKYLGILWGGEAWPHNSAIRLAQQSDLLLLV